ncbi:MAG: MFS transporter [Planctomycetaceae bacterium]
MGQTNAAPAPPLADSHRIHRGVIVLGIVSLLTDLSSEAIFAVLPIYFVSVLGGSAVLLGLMEGLADFSASSLDLASGYWSDRSGRRKEIAVSGYAVSALAKSCLVFLGSVGGVVAFRVIERLGKSVRGAPRDAILATMAPDRRRGLSFGLHKALDKAGAVAGPFVACLILAGWGASSATFHALFLAALIPAILAVVVLSIFVSAPPSTPGSKHQTVKSTWKSLGRPYRTFLYSSGIFSLGYFSFAFLMLKANTVGFAIQDQALLYGLFNLVFTLSSVPVGWLADRVGQRAIVIASYLAYAGMCAGFMIAETQLAVAVLFGVYGIFLAMNEGQAKAYLTDLTEDSTRATGIGLYGFVTGLAYLPASLIAGILWPLGPTWAFAFAVGTSIIALAVFLSMMERRDSRQYHISAA